MLTFFYFGKANRKWIFNRKECKSYKILNNAIKQIEFDNITKYNSNSSIFTTDENTIFLFFDANQIYENNSLPNNKLKVFEIIKVNKKIGRIKKKIFLKGKDNILSEDNIRL